MVGRLPDLPIGIEAGRSVEGIAVIPDGNDAIGFNELADLVAEAMGAAGALVEVVAVSAVARNVGGSGGSTQSWPLIPKLIAASIRPS